MSRSGYVDDWDPQLNLYRGAVERALHGKRGQAFLRKVIEALDAMPEKRLGAGSFQRGDCPCTLGVVAHHCAVDVADLEPTPEDDWVDGDLVGARFDIARCMAAEIMFENDEHYTFVPPTQEAAVGTWRRETPEERWHRMREWALRHLGETP